MMSLKAAAKETKTLLAQQQNLLVLDYRTGTFFAHVWVAPRIRNQATLVGGKFSQRCATLETKAKQYPVPARYINYYFPHPLPILDETLTRPLQRHFSLTMSLTRVYAP